MITEDEIARFPTEKQSEIRAEIAKMEKSGHEREFLMLTYEGSVLLDREALDDANYLKALRKLRASEPDC